MDKLDKKLKSLFKNNNLKMSDKYLNIINETLSQIPDNKTFHKANFKSLRLVLTTSCCLILVTTIVFGKDIGLFFQTIASKGIQAAIENDFIEINNSKPSEYNNTSVYIDSIIMDDYKLCICIKFELPTNYTNNNITNVEIPNILIYDDNENILFKHFFEEIDYSFFNLLNDNENVVTFDDGFSISNNKENNNTYSLTYVINGNNFPKSQKISLKFDKINLINKDILNNLSPDEIVILNDKERRNKSTVNSISGKWSLTYDLSKKTYERESYTYEIKNNNDYYKYNFPREIIVSNTETRLKFSYDLHDILDGEDISIDKEPYIKTENEILNITNSDHGYTGYISECDYTFELSTFNSTPTMQLIVPIENGEEIILNLERK